MGVDIKYIIIIYPQIHPPKNVMQYYTMSWGKPFYPQRGKITHPRIFIIHILYYCPSPDETVISSGKYVQKSLILWAFSGSQK